MNQKVMEYVIFEIEAQRQIHRCCPLYDYEVSKIKTLAAMIARHGGNYSHPMLCEKNRRIDYLTMIAYKNTERLPF